MTVVTPPTTRQQNRMDMEARIVDAARRLLVRPGELSLRAVARELGVTAPALYRYAASYEDLVRMVGLAIDADIARQLTEAADAQPADDPAARLIAATVAFRQWALGHREEFALVFTNVDVECVREHDSKQSCGIVFAGLLVALWERYRFPIPSLEDLDPGLADILRHPKLPVDAEVPDDLRGLVWLLERGWSRLYGTVTLEVFAHVDPRLVEQGHLFRAMIEDQASTFGLVEEMPRLGKLVDELLG